jgi:cyclopropane fatty-acyl-phospholipid synthase-like methyltransferase
MDTQRLIPTPEEVGLFYDRMGEVLAPLLGGTIHYGYWLGSDDNSSFAEAAERLTDVMIEKLDVGPGKLVLDLGCGMGRPAVRLARKTGAQIIGISVSANDVEKANQLARSEGLTDLVSFQRADAMDLPFPAESFDAVWALESMLHMPDRQHVLQQVSHVLRPGGQLVLSDIFQRMPVSEESWPVLDHLLATWKVTSLADLDDYPRMVRAVGLETRQLINVSEHTKYSFARMAEMFRRAAPEPTAQMEFMNNAVGSWQPRAETAKVGYLIMVANRMEAGTLA